MKTNLVIAALLGVCGVVLLIGLVDFGVSDGGKAGEETRPAGTSIPGTTETPAEDAAPHAARGLASGDGKPLRAAAIGGEAKAQVDPSTNPREKEARLTGIFRTAASLDPLAALEKVRQLPDRQSQDIAMLTLLGEWLGMTTAEILRNGDVNRFGVAGALALHLMNSGRIAPRQAADMADEFLSGDERVGVLGRAAGKIAAADPAAALALGEGLSGWQQTRFLARFAMGWAETQPEAARQWASQIADPAVRGRVMERILEGQVSGDPAVAAESFSQMPPDTPQSRARAARRIASEWAGRDTLAAMQWAESLTEPADRAAAQQGIQRAAPVGIGAMLNQGAQGIPVVADIVPGSSASTSGALKVGDQVVAVGDASGGWVDSRSVPLGQLTSLIRGEPNTQVSLQVLSPGESSPRVITLGRQQIIHRPQQ